MIQLVARIWTPAPHHHHHPPPPPSWNSKTWNIMLMFGSASSADIPCVSQTSQWLSRICSDTDQWIQQRKVQRPVSPAIIKLVRPLEHWKKREGQISYMIEFIGSCVETACAAESEICIGSSAHSWDILTHLKLLTAPYFQKMPPSLSGLLQHTK